MAQVLRDYQAAGVRSILAAWHAGARSVLAVAPTGSGKTTLFTSLIESIAQPALIVVHRRELATQAASRLLEFGVPFGFIMSGEPRRPLARVQIASVQTLVRRKVPRAVLVVADEAHLSTAATWAKVLAQYPQARVLGVTATPWRLGGKPLAGAYDACVVVARPAELREQGHLCGYVGFGYLAPDLSGVKATGGDYNERQSAEKMRAPQIVANVVEQWKAHAAHLSTVVFAVTVEHSQQLAAEFRAAGATAEHLDGATPIEQRKAILRRVESGATQVLCNVGVAVEGLDIPRLKCCVLARPTLSLTRYMQMCGRVRRPWQGQMARIHDHAFLIRKHGLPDDERDYSLTAKPEAPGSLRQCQQCLAMYAGARCPSCDSVNEPTVIERQLVTVDDAERFEFGSETALPAPPRPPVPVTWSEVGKTIEGVYVEDQIEQAAWGTRRRYIVRGKRRDYSLPGSAHLDRLMRRVPKGRTVRVTYLYDVALPGMRTKRIFRVEVDDGE